MTTGKTIALTRWTFAGKVIYLLFNILSVAIFQSLLKLCLVLSSKEQVSFNFMAAVTVCSDFGAKDNSLSLFTLFPHLFAMKR